MSEHVPSDAEAFANDAPDSATGSQVFEAMVQWAARWTERHPDVIPTPKE